MIVIHDANLLVASIRRTNLSDFAWLSPLMTLGVTSLFAFGYSRFARTGRVAEGVGYGVFFALMAGLLVDLNQYLLYPIPGHVAFYWFVGGLFEFSVYGASITKLYPVKLHKTVIDQFEHSPGKLSRPGVMKIVLLGNAGAGKSTMAGRLIGGRNIPRLSLDKIAWHEGTERKPLEASLRELYVFIENNDQWVIEGCYGDLVDAALPYCTELRFLNPGVEVCVEHCKRRPWEPTKFSSAEDQQAMLDQLIQWVREYESRDDEYGLKRHRSIFDNFPGPKREYTMVASYDAG